MRAHLLEMAGHQRAAHDAYQAAARRTASLPHQRYLNARAELAVSPQAGADKDRPN